MATVASPPKKTRPKLSPELQAMADIDRIMVALDERAAASATAWFYGKYCVPVAAQEKFPP